MIYSLNAAAVNAVIAAALITVTFISE